MMKPFYTLLERMLSVSEWIHSFPVTQYNQQKTYKRFIPITEKSDSIASLTLSPDRHLVAVAEKSSKPVIHIYDVSSLRKRKTLVCGTDSFTADVRIHFYLMV